MVTQSAPVVTQPAAVAAEPAYVPLHDTDPPESSGGSVRGPGQAEAAASSSTATSLVRFGSTWMPGPMVVETVTFLM